MSKETGGMAFPQCGYEDSSDRYWDSSEFGGTGMTLRDYFAAKALQGFIAGAMADGTPLGDRSDVDNITLTAYVIADSMLNARNQ